MSISLRTSGRASRFAFLAFFLFCYASVVPAQTSTKRPPADAKGQDAASVRQQILSSGMTPEQIRSKLVARGIPPNILDAYLGPSIGGTEANPTADVLAAVAALADADRGAADATTARAAAISSAPVTRNGLPIFGLQTFRSTTNQFQPNLAGPVDASYKLGALDVIAIVATGQVELSYALEVSRDGFIVIPVVGQVFVANLTLDQATQAIVQKMRGSYAGAGTGTNSPTRVYVTVTRLRTNQIYVIGDVVIPGTYSVSAAGTAFSALYAAGGPTTIGSMRNIKIISGRDTSIFDAYAYLLRGDASGDKRLQNGDRIFVPPAARFISVVGEVVRPGVYELTGNETLAELISSAGGFTPYAAANRLQITRILPAAQRSSGGRDRTVVDVTGPELARGVAPRTPLFAGDSVTVFPITSPDRDKVTISGNVWAAGEYGLRRGMKLSELIRASGGLKSDTYMAEVQITRKLPDGTSVMFRPHLLDTLGRANPDMDLQEQDSIRIFSISEFRPDRYVSVGGAVNKPGNVPYVAGLTLRQAILSSKGLHESALLTEVEIARMPADRKAGQQASIFRVTIDSTYLFERGPDGKYAGPPGTAAKASGAPEVELLPYDQVNVLRQTDWEMPASVSVSGEVRFPGSYAIERRGEKISDVIKRAGGFTDRAYPDAFVFRTQLTQDEIDSRKKFLDRITQDQAYAIAIERAQAPAGAVQNAAAEATTAVQNTLAKSLEPAGENQVRVAVDLAKIMDDPSRADNFRLRSGDQLVIPAYRPIVSVSGFVNAPVALPYREGATINDYVLAAGGVSLNGDVKRAFVQQPNGQIDAFKKGTNPRAGSLIVVPAKEIKLPKASTTPWTAIVAALASIATAAAAITAVSK